jgi:hypothetical protein
VTAILCRRCGTAEGDLTMLWKADRHGRLAPYAAQHRQPCGVPPKPSPTPPALAVPAGGARCDHRDPAREVRRVPAGHHPR